MPSPGVAASVAKSKRVQIVQAVHDLGKANALLNLTNPSNGQPLILTFTASKIGAAPEPEEIDEANGPPYFAVRRAKFGGWMDPAEETVGSQFARQVSGEGRSPLWQIEVYCILDFDPINAASYDFPLAEQVLDNLEMCYQKYYGLPDGNGVPTCDSSRVVLASDPIQTKMAGGRTYIVINLGIEAVESIDVEYY